MFCHCFILQRDATDVIVWMLPTSMDIMDLLKELSQKTRVFDHQIEANTLQPTLNGMGQGKDYTKPGFLLRFGTFSPIKYRGNRPSTFSHQPILGLLFSREISVFHMAISDNVGGLDTMFFHIFSDIFCIVLRPNDTSQLPESLLSVPLVLPPRSSGCQGWSPGWSACGASTAGAGLPPPNSHLVSSKNAGKTTNFTSMV